MSDEPIAKLRVAREAIAITVGVLALTASIVGVIGSWYMLLHRVQAVEVGLLENSRKLETVVSFRQSDRELLTRIEERQIAIQNELKRLKP